MSAEVYFWLACGFALVTGGLFQWRKDEVAICCGFVTMGMLVVALCKALV